MMLDRIIAKLIFLPRIFPENKHDNYYEDLGASKLYLLWCKALENTICWIEGHRYKRLDKWIHRGYCQRCGEPMATPVPLL